MAINSEMITTAFDLPGYKVIKSLGLAKAISVRSCSVVGNVGAGIQAFFGGNISIFTKLCEDTRQEAYELLLKKASKLGANAVIGLRYDATEIASGVTEVLVYGTAVVVEKEK